MLEKNTNVCADLGGLLNFQPLILLNRHDSSHHTQPYSKKIIIIIVKHHIPEHPSFFTH